MFVCSSYVLEIGRFFGVYHFDAFSESIWTGAWGSSYFHWGLIGLARKKLEPCFCSFALKSFQWLYKEGGRVKNWSLHLPRLRIARFVYQN